jgi:tricorn protease
MGWQERLVMRFRPVLFLGLLAFLTTVGDASRSAIAPPGPGSAPASAPVAEAGGGPTLGYYRSPAIHGETVVFVAEGDLWQVGLRGGVARRLTTHPAEEGSPAISPDGKTLAFAAVYEGPREVYTMPLDGGVPVRQTYGGPNVVGWTPEGKILYATDRYATLPDTQLVALDPRSKTLERVPLAQASDGSYDASGKTLYFTRLPFQGSHAKRYKGGTVQNLWKWMEGAPEATPLTGDYAGTSKSPMWWRRRVYFASDRDGTMNLWSMDENGGDLRQHTRHHGWDVQSPALHDGRIVYQLGADLRLLDLHTNTDTPISIRLASDFDQMRERWVKKPMEYVSSMALSPTGDRIALTARGQVFVVPARQGRLVEVTRRKGVRYREARFMPDAGKPGADGSLVALSDESGEVELWTLPARGIGRPEQLTRDGGILRWEAVPSPDGRWIAHHDKNQQLWLHHVAEKKSRRIAKSEMESFGGLAWSPDSRWLAYVESAANQRLQIKLHDTKTGEAVVLTSDRYDSYDPGWSADGKWIYFLSDRTFQSLVGSPWGPRQPEPFFDRQTRIYMVALRKGQRSPFQPRDELAEPEAGEKKEEPAKEPGKETGKQPEKSKTPAKAAKKPADTGKKPADAAKKPATPTVTIDREGLAARLYDVPAPAGNYRGLSVAEKRLYWRSRERSPEPKQVLQTLEITNDDPKPETFADDIRQYELSQDRKKLLIRKGDDLFVFDAGAKAPDRWDKGAVDLKGWTFSLDPREEWRQMFIEAWRLHRDYFYDPGMHRIDWPAMRAKYLPLVSRVTDRAELSNLIAQMVSELSALHTFVGGGDTREGTDQIQTASLGAELVRDAAAGGWRVRKIYRADPDIPDRVAPLARPGVDVAEGDVIEMINGVETLSVPDPAVLLRNQVGKQVLLRVRPGEGKKPREVVVKPISPGREWDLRYEEWEYTRRLAVEKMSAGKLAYVHLRAMGSGDIAQWTREFYPVFNREGLIVDVRHNGGGNIDSWILEKLMRRAWMYWQPRVGKPYWNMQYAFRGPMVVLCNERTGSDGEAFTEGFRRLGLGKVIGTRTWGGEIWLSASNVLVDRGIATAGEFGVYGPEGQWLIEGHGVDPDMVVDNLPHATFKGKDAQLDAAVQYLLEEIRRNPVTVPPTPRYPDKSYRAEGR